MAAGPSRLFTEECLDAYADGEAAQLVTRRNRRLGALLTADRAVFYVQILYRLLLFRRDHELEPLYDDIYDAVKIAQREAGETADYTAEQFRTDMEQLREWELVTSRIELERLRGYRDTRKRKFRHSLTHDSIAFVEWLEERLQEELEGPEDDTRDLLEEVCGDLQVLLRLINRFQTKRSHDDDPRRILFQLVRLDRLSLAINDDLGTFNARLLGFVVRHYELVEAKRILTDLDRFVNEFLLQINELRDSIVKLVNQLLQPRQQEKLAAVLHLMEEERRRVPNLLRRQREARSQERIPLRLREFYKAGGKLDLLCQRIQGSAIRVWRKLHSHLRELERKNNRIEDLRDRTREIAALPPSCVPHAFISRLVASGGMLTDQHYWDDNELAEPPQPRRRPIPRQRSTPPYLPSKSRREGPVMSMERARLERLKQWMETTIGVPYAERRPRVSQGAFVEFADFARIMDLSRSGLLGSGRKLRRVSYRLDPESGELVTVDVDDANLSFKEMTLSRVDEPS